MKRLSLVGVLDGGNISEIDGLSETAREAAVKESALREIEVLKLFRYPNTIRLYGYMPSLVEEDPLLLYELAEYGSLAQNLIDDEAARKLSWKIRCQVAAGLARALNFLHRSQDRPAHNQTTELQ